MFCSGCGNDVPVGERFCRVCGKEAGADSAPVPTLGPPAEGTVFPAQTSGKAIVSLACGLFVLAFPLSIVAIILGHLSVAEIRKSSGRLKGEGLAIAGLILGYFGLAAIPVALIVAAIVMPNLRSARMAANESSAVMSVRQVVSAEIVFSSSHPQEGYTCNLADLAKAELIDPKLSAFGQKKGYDFELSGCRAVVEGGPKKRYLMVAYPAVRDETGSKSFCSDESGVVKRDVTGSRDHCMVYGSAQR